MTTPNPKQDPKHHTTVRLPASYHAWVTALAEKEGISFAQGLNMAITMAMTFEILSSQEEFPVIKTAVDKVAYSLSDEDKTAAFWTDEEQQAIAEKYPRVKGFKNRPDYPC